MLAMLVLAVSIDDRNTRNNLQPIRRSIESFNTVAKDDCKHQLETIRMALHHLSSGEYSQTQQANHKLRTPAYKSNACRQNLIRALMERMDKPDLDFEKQPSNYYLWREAAQLLGEIKATEALDLLISHLDLTNGFHSASMVFQPAVRGVCTMGAPAIPKLAFAVRENPKPRIRKAAAYCLTSIGGEAAMQVLSQAREKETNQCVSNFITVSLNTFSYKSKGVTRFDNEAPQANTEARRTWLVAFQCLE